MHSGCIDFGNDCETPSSDINPLLKGLTVVSRLCVGDPVNVEGYCKNLIDVVGKGGGFILDGGIGIADEARPENVQAIADIVKTYGVYT